MNPHDVINGMFTNTMSTLSGGMLTNFKSLLVTLGGILLILFAFDLITRILTGSFASDHAGDWWEKKGVDQEYKQYKKRRVNKEKMAARYESEKNLVGPMKKGKGFYDN